VAARRDRRAYRPSPLPLRSREPARLGGERGDRGPGRRRRERRGKSR